VTWHILAWIQAQLMNPVTWQVIGWIGSIIIGGAVNIAIMSYYVGTYKERVERLTEEVQRYEDKVEEMDRELGRFGRQLAAFTGKANGGSYREGD
jgi:hypothetical protein